MASQTIDIWMVFNDKMCHGHQHRPWLQQNQRPIHGSRKHHGFGWQGRPVTLACSLPPTHLQFSLSPQHSAPLVSHLSTACSLILAVQTALVADLAVLHTSTPQGEGAGASPSLLFSIFNFLNFIPGANSLHWDHSGVSSRLLFLTLVSKMLDNSGMS